MEPFSYLRALDEADALAAAANPDAELIAGGTTVVDLLRLDVMRPRLLIDISGLPLAAIEEIEGGVRIGAMARNSDVARHPLIAARYPALAQALLAGASPQLRNMATVGGNLLQRTRCPYFRDLASACNKRVPGSGCAAQTGYTRAHAVLGGGRNCIAVNPSDMNVALVALDAMVHARGAAGRRAIPMTALHTEPGEHPELETVLGHGELITHIELPASRLATRSGYVKVRDRASFAFALASAAVALDIEGGSIRDARVALGGVATRPWRSHEAEEALIGQRPVRRTFERAAVAALSGATPRGDNAFKIELARRTVVRALEKVGGVS
jgi:xanthine dehydrogenase YagS FAD-binding subunit